MLLVGFVEAIALLDLVERAVPGFLEKVGENCHLVGIQVPVSIECQLGESLWWPSCAWTALMGAPCATSKLAHV